MAKFEHRRDLLRGARLHDAKRLAMKEIARLAQNPSMPAASVTTCFLPVMASRPAMSPGKAAFCAAGVFTLKIMSHSCKVK